MSTATPRNIIEKASLSEAWLAAFSTLTAKGMDTGSPLIVSFTKFDDCGFPKESGDIRGRLDKALVARNGVSVETSAFTIFPLASLKLLEARLDRRILIAELSEYYQQFVYPRMRAHNARANGKGTYFLRMIAFGKNPKDATARGLNQIEKMLEVWQGNDHIVQSALQLAIRDPSYDITRNPRPFFPCLQQVSFAYDRAGGISVTGYYPTQYIFDRAYGNYLGLSHLGWFMAREMKKRLVRVNCICAHPLLGGEGKDKAELRKEFDDVSMEVQ